MRTDNGDNNVLEAYATDGLEDCIIRRGFRGGTFVATYKFKWNDSSTPGFLVRWLTPGDYLALGISADDDKPRLYRRRLDGNLTTLATAASGLGLTNAEWYEAKVVITESGGDQLLNFYVDTNQDSDFLDAGEHVLTDRGEVDDNWSAGYVGLYRAPGGSSAQEFDNLKVGYDNNSDGDIADAGDDIQIEDDFSSNVMSLTYDNNGSLTDDGIFEYVYDGWNRLVEVTRRPDAETTVATYEYYGDNRRSEKVVNNCGVEEIANDGGNTTIRYYYSNRWQILETRNGSNQTAWHWIWGTQYVDEPLLMDLNGDTSQGDDTDPDVTAGSEEDEANNDQRMCYVQDRNWNVVALVATDDGIGGGAGSVIERYVYTPYGECTVLQGTIGATPGFLRNVNFTSSVGNPFLHQGLPFDQEKGSYQNRNREYPASLQRFAQPDRPGHEHPSNVYGTLGTCPVSAIDPLGLELVGGEDDLPDDFKPINVPPIFHPWVPEFYIPTHPLVPPPINPGHLWLNPHLQGLLAKTDRLMGECPDGGCSPHFFMSQFRMFAFVLEMEGDGCAQTRGMQSRRITRYLRAAVFGPWIGRPLFIPCQGDCYCKVHTYINDNVEGELYMPYEFLDCEMTLYIFFRGHLEAELGTCVESTTTQPQ